MASGCLCVVSQEQGVKIKFSDNKFRQKGKSLNFT